MLYLFFMLYSKLVFVGSLIFSFRRSILSFGPLTLARRSLWHARRPVLQADILPIFCFSLRPLQTIRPLLPRRSLTVGDLTTRQDSFLAL